MAEKAVIYARFSSDKQREESIEDQVRVCSQFAASKGFEIVKTYTDEARSGTNAAGRPGFQKMILDAQAQRWTKVIVYKTDRFARSRYDSAVYKAKLRKCGVEIVTAAESVPDGPDGIILESVLEGMAEYYSANLAQNVKRGMEGNALKCKHNGVSIFGYDRGADGYYAVNEHEAAGVRMAFDMCAAGETKAEIMRKLNGLGYKTVTGKPFSNEAVNRLLHCERYIGTYTWGDFRKENGMPSIINRDLWDSAHAHMASRGRKRRGKMNAEYLLSGKIYDADGNQFESDCGYGENGKQYHYYRCRKTKVSMRRDEVEDKVIGACARLLNENPDLDERIVDMVLARQDKDAEQEISAREALRRRITDVEREIDNAIDLACKLGSTDRMAVKINGLQDELTALKAELDEIKRGAPLIDRDMILFALYKMRQSDGPRGMVAAFVDRVTVNEDGSLLVQFILCRPTCENKKPEPSNGEFGKLICGSPGVNYPELFQVYHSARILPIKGGFGVLLAA